MYQTVHGLSLRPLGTAVGVSHRMLIHLLDLLATGDRAGVDAAMEEFLRLYYGSE